MSKVKVTVVDCMQLCKVVFKLSLLVLRIVVRGLKRLVNFHTSPETRQIVFYIVAVVLNILCFLAFLTTELYR